MERRVWVNNMRWLMASGGECVAFIVYYTYAILLANGMTTTTQNRTAMCRLCACIVVESQWMATAMGGVCVCVCACLCICRGGCRQCHCYCFQFYYNLHRTNILCLIFISFSILLCSTFLFFSCRNRLALPAMLHNLLLLSFTWIFLSVSAKHLCLWRYVCVCVCVLRRFFISLLFTNVYSTALAKKDVQNEIVCVCVYDSSVETSSGILMLCTSARRNDWM